MNDNITIWGCPSPGCNGKLIKRKSKFGNYFLGCTNFPSCKYTQKCESEEDERYPDGVADAATRWEEM